MTEMALAKPRIEPDPLGRAWIHVLIRFPFSYILFKSTIATLQYAICHPGRDA